MAAARKSLVSKVRPFYNSLVRPVLPWKRGCFNGVVIPDLKLGDGTVTDRQVNVPDYEDALVHFVQEAVEEGDTVTVVGGGQGVSTVYAARESKHGKITVYEAAEFQAERIRKVVDCRENRVKDPARVEVNHVVVGEIHDAWGKVNNARSVSPEDLEPVDTLILDCEGAELAILRNLSFKPKKLVVETHGCFDSPTEQVKSVLSNLGYCVISARWENQGKDVKVLYCKKGGDS